MADLETSLILLRLIAEEALQDPPTGTRRAVLEDKARQLLIDVSGAEDDATESGASGYVSQKLSGLSSSVLIAIGVEPRGNYTDEQILNNIGSFSHLRTQG